jgi:hypothetical protein
MLPWHRCLLIDLDHKYDMTRFSYSPDTKLDDAQRKRFSEIRQPEAYHIDARREGIIPQIRWNRVRPGSIAVGYIRPPHRFQAAR